MMKIYIKARLNLTSFWLFILLIKFSFNLFAQPNSNYQIFESLSDSISLKVLELLPDNISKIKITSVENEDLKVINNIIKASLIKNGVNICFQNDCQESLIITISNANVGYDNLFKEHLFGPYYMKREIELSGNFILENLSKTKEFNFVYTDTVNLSNYKELENQFYTFTQGKLPEEPFFSTLYEPIIVIASTLTAVLLFFNIRSK